MSHPATQAFRSKLIAGNLWLHFDPRLYFFLVIAINRIKSFPLGSQTSSGSGTAVVAELSTYRSFFMRYRFAIHAAPKV